MNKQQLASTIWESANQMRSKIEANEYKDYILGFFFYRYLSEQEVALMRSEGFTDEQMAQEDESDTDYMEHVQNELGYFISYKNLFSTWLSKGSDFDVSDVRDALSDFDANIDEVYRKVFDNIFNTLQTGLSKLGDSAQSQTKSIRGLLKLIKKIPMDGKQDYDVLGFIYEYLISNFAANAGKKAGEFYTPHEVSVLMSEIIADHLKDRETIRIYDPTSGSGSLLINIGHSVAKYMKGEGKIEYYAQELKENTFNLTRMNLVMRGIKPSNIFVRNGDTLQEDWPFFEDSNKESTYELVTVDAVVSNPPYSQKWTPKDAEFDPRFKEYGVAPKTKADYAFLLHDLYHLQDDGIMTIVLPHGVLFRGGEEGRIRENLIEKNRIDAIIGLPEKVFFGTGIATIIMVLKKQRPTTDVLFVDASKGFRKEGKNNKLRACDIKKIVDVIRNRSEVEKFSAVVSKKRIQENGYNLNIPRYVDSSEAETVWDIRATMFGGIPDSEIHELDDFWAAMPGLREKLFETGVPGYQNVRTENIKETILTHPCVDAYRKAFRVAFDDLSDWLKKDLIDDILDVAAEPEKEKITEDVFRRISKLPLAEKYQAYQVLAEKWDVISADLEMIQGEGFTAINQVDPHMVIKKKKADDEEVPEVQDGWEGHILPFELVQKELLQEEFTELQDIDGRLSEISSLYAEIIDSMDPEDKESSAALNEANDGFDTKGLRSAVAEILADVESEEISTLEEYLKLSKKKEKLEYIESHDGVQWEAMAKGADGTYKKSIVNNRIKTLQMDFEFPEDSFDEKLVQALKLLDEENGLKQERKDKKDALEKKTKEVIETLDEDTSLHILELKWIIPLVEGLDHLADEIVDEYSGKIISLCEKYRTTYADVENQMVSTNAELYDLLGQLKGPKSDMEGIMEFRDTLGV